VIVTTVPGPLDIFARLICDKVATALKQPFVIENKAGAGGNIGADIVAKSPADGYTLLFALDTTFTSSPILVDNRKPEVVGLTVKYPVVTGRARDDQSPLVALEYSVDGGDWQILSAADGICDDLVEAFTIKLPPLAPGPHAVAVRAWDSADNVGAASISLRAPGK